MITLIDNEGYPVAWSTTGNHGEYDCLMTLKIQNDFMEEMGIGRIYVEAVNEDGERFVDKTACTPSPKKSPISWTH